MDAQNRVTMVYLKLDYRYNQNIKNINLIQKVEFYH